MISKDKFYLIIIAALIVIILLMKACGNPSKIECPEIKQQTVKVDTFFIEGKDSIVYKPGITTIIPGKTEYKDVDTTAILKDYFSKIVYNDTIRLDIMGYVLIKDTISQNRIVSRTTVKDYRIPVIKETITNNITPSPKTQLYGGFDILGNKKEPINYFGGSLTLKTKKDQLYNIGLGLTPDGVGGKFGTQWPIRFKNHNKDNNKQ